MSDLPPILDACCGGRMFWFDKQNPNALFADIREETLELVDGRKFEVNPDVVADFRSLPFPDKSFKLVVFDPPHMKAGPNGWQAKKYGSLGENWRDDLSKGFSECWRVLDNYGVLIFKWHEYSVKIKDVLALFDQKPLFGHPTKRHGQTHWMCFMKFDNPRKEIEG